jgi:hypothetical protein
MALSDFINMVEDFAQIAVTLLLAYVAYKIAVLVDTINGKIKAEKTT